MCFVFKINLFALPLSSLILSSIFSILLLSPMSKFLILFFCDFFYLKKNQFCDFLKNFILFLSSISLLRFYTFCLKIIWNYLLKHFKDDCFKILVRYFQNLTYLAIKFSWIFLLNSFVIFLTFFFYSHFLINILDILGIKLGDCWKLLALFKQLIQQAINLFRIIIQV